MEFKESILRWIMSQKKDYNYINKRFQDTVMNYFLEDYIAPLLMQDYNLQVYREIHVILKNKLKLDKDRVLPKYMGILNIYTNELKDKNRYNEYKRKLCDIVQEETANSSSNYNSAMWKKLVAYLLLEHSVNNSIKNFNGMWQSAFPDRPLKQIKYPKYSKNNTSYYKKRMQVLKQKESEFDEQQNSKNNQVILNMLLGLNTNISPESQNKSSLICEVSNKPQNYISQQIQIPHYSSNPQQNYSSLTYQIACPIPSYSSSNGSINNSQKNEKKTSHLINEKVEIKQEAFSENNENQRRFSTDQENGDQEDSEEQASSNSCGLAKIEDQYENEYDYQSSQQQSYASSSQSTVSRYEIQQKFPFQQQQQQKFDLQQQQQQNQIYCFINSKPTGNSNYNNYQNLYNPINNFNSNNNINNNNINNSNIINPNNFYNNGTINNNPNYSNYYNFPEKVSQYQQYQDEVYDELPIQEQPQIVNGEYNEPMDHRQMEEVYYCEEDFPKPFQPSSLLGVNGNNYPPNNFICNDYNDYQ